MSQFVSLATCALGHLLLFYELLLAVMAEHLRRMQVLDELEDVTADQRY